MRRRIYLFIPMLLALAGCGSNAGNPDAPLPVSAHERSWVTNHRDFIVDARGARTTTVNGALVVDGVLLNEHVTQCRVCHGADFQGARGGAAGPACLDCHVLDPVKYPIMCYSCHGGWPVVPVLSLYTSVDGLNFLRKQGWPTKPLQQWFSTSRAQRGGVPIDPGFINAVRTTPIHLKHKAIPAMPFDATFNRNQLTANSECSVCHGQPNDIGERHHALLGRTLVFRGQTVTIGGCLAPVESAGGCHTFVLGGDGFVIETDCLGCHGAPP